MKFGVALFCGVMASVLGIGEAASSERAIRFASDLPTQQVLLLDGDMNYLKNADLSKSSPEVLRSIRHLMHLKKTRGADLTRWLQDRVQYVISENWDASRSIYSSTLEDSGFVYPYPGIVPSLNQEGSSRLQESSQLVKMMSNIGTGVYMMGKESAKLLAMDIPGFDLVQMTSPRVGVIQVGEGLFEALTAESKDLATSAHKIQRLATFFHEARHSDGHAMSLGFVHSVCPPGHEFAGRVACDHNLNGPYLLGGQILQGLLDRCRDCAIVEKEIIKLIAFDSVNRVIYDGATEWNDAPEGVR